MKFRVVGSMNPYSVLGVDKEASQAAIKQAYYKLALQYHPDRHLNEASKEEAAIKFKEIGMAYECLSNADRRALYDSTGSYEVESVDWKDLFKRVSMANLDAFKQQYQGSKEEADDIIRLWRESKGKIEAVVDGLFFGDDDHIDRYLRVIKGDDNNNLICPDDRVAAVLKRRRRQWRQREAKEAAQLEQELGLTNQESLGQVIKGRAKDRFDSMIANLEAKYTKPKKTTAAATGKKSKK